MGRSVAIGSTGILSRNNSTKKRNRSALEERNLAQEGLLLLEGGQALEKRFFRVVHFERISFNLKRRGFGENISRVINRKEFDEGDSAAHATGRVSNKKHTLHLSELSEELSNLLKISRDRGGGGKDL
jgi:hypothetical protein